MTRAERWAALASHPWHAKRLAKLRPPERAFAESFIAAHGGASADDWQLRVNRLFLDDPQKPKNWTLIIDLLANICG